MRDSSAPRSGSPAPDIGDDLVRVVRLLHVARQHAPRQHPQVDPMAYPLLHNLRAEPMRVSTLAEVLHCDVSTVSRQVSTLVDLGFVTRGPDPDDRRAQALTLTDAGEGLLLAIRDQRDAWMRGLLRDWDDDDVATFSTHLRSFASTLEASLTDVTALTSGTDR